MTGESKRASLVTLAAILVIATSVMILRNGEYIQLSAVPSQYGYFNWTGPGVPSSHPTCQQPPRPLGLWETYVKHVHPQALRERRLVLIQLPPTGGLCNRFQTLVSGLALAMLSGRALVWDWPRLDPLQANAKEQIGHAGFEEVFRPLPFKHSFHELHMDLNDQNSQRYDNFGPHLTETLALIQLDEWDVVWPKPVLHIDRYDLWGAVLWTRFSAFLPPPAEAFARLFTPLESPLPTFPCGTLIQRRAHWDRETAPLSKFLELATLRPIIITSDSDTDADLAALFAAQNASWPADDVTLLSEYCRDSSPDCTHRTVSRMIQLAHSCTHDAILTHTSSFGLCIVSLIGTLQGSSRVRLLAANGQVYSPVFPDWPLVESGTLPHEPHYILDSIRASKPTVVQTVVAVISRRNGFERRQAIRDTWIKLTRAMPDPRPLSSILEPKTRYRQPSVKVVFVVGNRDCHIHPRVREEYDCVPQCGIGRPSIGEVDEFRRGELRVTEAKLQQEIRDHDDVLVVDVLDVYRQLPHKMKEAYRSILARFPTAQWIVKVDDDSAARLDQLHTYLMTIASVDPLMYHEGEINTRLDLVVVGRILHNGDVHRGGKWAEHDYQPSFYPPFPLGSSGHAITRPLAQFVVDLDGFEYQGEDTSLGIWLAEHPERSRIRWITSDFFHGHGNCIDPVPLVVGHDIGPDKMRECFPTTIPASKPLPGNK